MNVTSEVEVVHSVPLRERAELRVELLPDDRIRLGLYRGPALDELTLAAGFAVTADQARELRSALALAIAKLEAETA